LLGVEVQIGRTGAITPVAVLAPADLGGVIVSRASLHNFEFAQSILKASELKDGDGDIGVPKGASVMISRAGDVIPQVLRRLEDDVEVKGGMNRSDFISLRPPDVCPACGSETVFEVVGGRATKSKKAAKVIETEEETADGENVGSAILSANLSDGTQPTRDSIGQVLRCGGPQLLCKPRAVGALSHAFSRAGLDITGLSEARLQQLVNATLIRTPVDLFNILDEESDMFQNITELPGWGDKSALNLRSASQKVATEGVSLSKFVYSLGIRHVGVHSSSLIASAYGSSSEFLSALEEASKIEEEHGTSDNKITTPILPALTGDDSGEGVKGIGPVVIDSLVSFAKNEELMNAAKSLAERLPIRDVKRSKANSPSDNTNEGGTQLPFVGKSVVFTGSLPGKMTRTMAQNYAIDLFGATSTPSSVSKSTGVVVIGEKGGKKAEQAKDLGIQIMSAEDFAQLVEKYN